MAQSLLERAVKNAGADAVLSALTPDQLALMRYQWELWARPEQLLPEWAWRVWLILAGRGFGKTRTGAETVRQWAKKYRYVNLIGATADDARDIMIDGESGILAVCPPDERPEYKKADRQLVWPNGCRSLVFTADEPERLRGKQHDKLWADELAAWRYADAWTQAMLGLRLGDNPQAIVTTTPRPTPLIKKLAKASTTALTVGTTYDNRSNLAPAFYAEIVSQYEGTRIGRQELNAEILEDTPGALWKIDTIDKSRVQASPSSLVRVVVAVDPSGGSEEGKSDEQGVIVAAVGLDGHAYVLADVSLCGTPDEWGRAAIGAYLDYKADKIIAEKNYGGEMVDFVVQTAAKAMGATVFVKMVDATRGKQVRAEPIAALYEQGRVHHVGDFAKLESQMCTYVPKEQWVDENAKPDERGKKKRIKGSPDRMDALVWALTELMMNEPVTLGAEPVASGIRRGDEAPPSEWADEDDAPSARGRRR